MEHVHADQELVDRGLVLGVCRLDVVFQELVEGGEGRGLELPDKGFADREGRAFGEGGEPRADAVCNIIIHKRKEERDEGWDGDVFVLWVRVEDVECRGPCAEDKRGRGRGEGGRALVSWVGVGTEGGRGVGVDGPDDVVGEVVGAGGG